MVYEMGAVITGGSAMTEADICFTLFLDLHSSARPAFVKFVEDIAFGMPPHGCRVFA